MKAIQAVGGDLKVAYDPNDSVGIIDSHFPDAHFFTEFERFDRHVDKLRRRGEKIDYVSICSPNHLHDAHCRFALALGRRCDLRKAAGAQSLEHRRSCGDRARHRPSHLDHPAAAAASGDHRAAREVCEEQRTSQGRSDLHRLARPLVSRIVEGRGRQVRRRCHQYRRAFLRHAELRVRPRPSGTRRICASPSALPAFSSASAPTSAGSCRSIATICRESVRARKRPSVRSRSTAKRSNSPKASPTCTPAATRKSSPAAALASTRCAPRSTSSRRFATRPYRAATSARASVCEQGCVVSERDARGSALSRRADSRIELCRRGCSHRRGHEDLAFLPCPRQAPSSARTARSARTS